MLTSEQIAAVGTELVARVGKKRARVVIGAAKATIQSLIEEHGEEIAAQVIATLAVTSGVQASPNPAAGPN